MQLLCNGTTIALDNRDGDVTFLSHAHSDHASGLKRQKKLISSKETLDLAGLDAELVSVPGTRMVDAGHIFGSRQLVAEEEGRKTVYTGDICLKKNIFGNVAEIAQCDRLIIEATYGSDPRYKFSNPFAVYQQLADWVRANDNSNIIIGAYELGKAQELVKVLNDYCSISPIVTEKAEKFCKVYEEHGMKLDRITIGSEESEEVMSHRFVGVVPMRHAKKYFASRLANAFERKTLCAVATGWALTYRFNADAAFPLSDHADFHDLLRYVQESNAKEIEFFAGNGKRVLEALGR